MLALSRLFRPLLSQAPKQAVRVAQAYKASAAKKGLAMVIAPEELAKSQASVTVVANQHYLNAGDHTPSLARVLTRTAAVNIAGDRYGRFQDGTPFPVDRGFFSSLKAGDPRGLSPDERLAAGKKIIVSNSVVFASGGYPIDNPRVQYRAPLQVGIFSQAGSQFEMPYLHYSLFGLDAAHDFVKNPLFEHLYDDLPTSFDDAKRKLGVQTYSPDLSRIRLGFSFLARKDGGDFCTSWSEDKAIIFLNKAYERHILEDTALLLASVNEFARQAGKPAFLKATAIGMGFFAKVDGYYDIQHHLYPYYLRAFQQLLQTGQYPHIGVVEFPTFSPLFEQYYEGIFTEKSYGGVQVEQSSRDVLSFTAEEQEKYYPCVVNPSDANALPGNEQGDSSVESAIANNSSLRLDQVHLVNPLVLEPDHHMLVKVSTDFKTEILAPLQASLRLDNSVA